MKTVPATADGIAEAARAIREGLVVAYPTETVYGLGVDPFSEKALARVFACKDRSQDTPLLLIAADLDQVAQVTETIGPEARSYAEVFWPGPLSMLLRKSECVPSILTAGSAKVCIRVPGDDIAQALCRAVGRPIVSTSANLTGAPPVRSLKDLAMPGVAVGIDGGVLPERAVSTILDPESGTVLREGAVTSEMLSRITAG